MRIVGLTGSIAAGKTTTAGMFRRSGVPVFDSDAAVHSLYEGPLAADIERAFPGTATEGRVDRALLADRIVDDRDALSTLERIVHPKVREIQAEFLHQAAAAGHGLSVLDIPLLMETASEGRVDIVVLVFAAVEVRRARALARPGMTAQKLDALLARQLPDDEKRRRAHFILDTGGGLDRTERDIAALLRALAGGR